MKFTSPRTPRNSASLSRVAIVAIVAGVALGGCSSDAPSSSSAPPSVAPTTPPTTPPGATDASTASSGAPASTSDAPTGEPTDEQRFSVNISEPASLDPAMASEVEGAHVIRLLFQTLVSLSPELEVVPGVATEWAVGDDGVTWTFTLADDAVFSDGNPVTAQDFAYEFARAADPDLASPSSYQGLPIVGWADVNGAEPSGEIGDEPVSGVTVVDDRTLQIVTDGPFGLLPKLLTYPVFAPVQASTVAGGQAESFAEQPIGNGLYKMEGPWQHNVGITVVRNESYTGTPGVADAIDFKIYADFETSFKEFQAGNLDIGRGIPAPEISSAQAEYGDRFLITSSAQLYYLGLPTTLPPFDNVDIRTALSLAIDREAIAERVYQGAQSPATGVVPALVPGALAGPCAACVFDPEKAKELFDGAGGVPGNTIVLYDISDDGQDALEPIINSWREVLGVDVEVRSFAFAQFLDEINGGNVEGPHELGWVWDYPSGYSMLSPLYETTSDANAFSYSSDEFDALMQQVRNAPDEETALPYLARAEQIIEEELPLIPVLFGNDIGVYSERLTNVKVDTGAFWRLELVEFTG